MLSDNYEGSSEPSAISDTPRDSPESSTTGDIPDIPDPSALGDTLNEDSDSDPYDLRTRPIVFGCNTAEIELHALVDPGYHTIIGPPEQASIVLRIERGDTRKFYTSMYSRLAKVSSPSESRHCDWARCD